MQIAHTMLVFMHTLGTLHMHVSLSTVYLDLGCVTSHCVRHPVSVALRYAIIYDVLFDIPVTTRVRIASYVIRL